MTTTTKTQDCQNNAEAAKLDGAVEAVIASLDRAVTPARLAEIMCAGDVIETPEGGSPDLDQLEQAVGRLNEVYERTGRAFRIERLSGGWRLMTNPEYAAVIAASHRSRTSGRLSRPALETLSIVAYRQPVTRAELEAIRGVGCGEVLRALLDRKLVKVTGRAEELGRPMLYGTTKTFLDVFGLASLADLPRDGDLAGATNVGSAAEPETESTRKDS